MEVVATWWRDDKNFISDREVVAPPVQMLLKQSDFRTDLESAASSVTLIIITHTHLVSLLYTVTEEGSRGLEKAAINRIFLILPSRKEEREILFPFRLEMGAEGGNKHTWRAQYNGELCDDLLHGRGLWFKSRMAQLRQGKEYKKDLTPSCMLHLARGDIAQLVELRSCNWVVAITGWVSNCPGGNDSILYLNRWLTFSKSSMDRTWTVVGVGGSPRVPSSGIDPWGRGSSFLEFFYQ
uniref:Uncharacterized protein n=1 Tax=Brassica campestris TaxID=3711 RepID=M4DWZ1_BRACM